MIRNKHFVTIASALVFILLFFEKSLGINVGLYSILSIALLWIFKTGFFNSLLNKVVASGLIISGVAYSFYGSPFSLAVAFFSFLMLFGLHSIDSIKNLINAIPNGITNYFTAWGDFFRSMNKKKAESKRTRRFDMFFKVGFIPLLILIAFAILYGIGNKQFGIYLVDLIEWIGDSFGSILSNLNLSLIMVGILGVAFGVLHALVPNSTIFSQHDSTGVDPLQRIRTKPKRNFGLMDLKYELRSATFLFIGLNLLIVLLIIAEVHSNWLNFEWGGELLKANVREGTYALIVSILVSIGLTAYFFRANLNYYSKNKTLLLLSKVWILLNAMLVIAVAVRNYHYVQHFALAYKRIGVYFFLMLCIYGLYTLWIKISKQKTVFYLVRKNALVAYAGIVLLCIFNWDVIIAKYNIKHADRSFLHLPFIISLSDKALPYIELSDKEISAITEKQLKAVPFVGPDYFDQTNYKEEIEFRIGKFKSKFENESLLEKRIAEMKAYRMLSD